MSRSARVEGMRPSAACAPRGSPSARTGRCAAPGARDRSTQQCPDDLIWIEPVHAPGRGKEVMAATLADTFTGLPDTHLPVEDYQLFTSVDPPTSVVAREAGLGTSLPSGISSQQVVSRIPIGWPTSSGVDHAQERLGPWINRNPVASVPRGVRSCGRGGQGLLCLAGGGLRTVPPCRRSPGKPDRDAPRSPW